MKPFILILSILACAGAAGAQNIAATPLAGEIVLDGKLDDAAWQKATVHGGFHRLMIGAAQDATVSAATDFRVLASADAVYIGIRCQEPLMDKLVTRPIARDGAVWNSDSVEVFLDPTGKGAEYYQFMLSADNVQFDKYYIEGGNTSGEYYSALWESAVYKGKDFWSAEIKLPLTAFFFTPAAQFAPDWRINVARERQAKPELTTWSKLKNTFQEPLSFGQIEAMPKKPAKFDLRINSLDAALDMPLGTGYKGELQVGVTANTPQNAKDQYSLEVQPLSGARGTGVSARSQFKLPAGEENTVGIPDVTFSALGESLNEVRLRNGGEIVAAAILPLRTKYQPIAIDLTSPFYAGSIFPGQKVDDISGFVRLSAPAATLRGAQVVVTLESDAPDNAFKVRTTTQAATSSVPFTFPAAALEIGDYRIRAELTRDQKITATTTTPVRKLPVVAGNTSYIDKDLNMVINGKPTIVRGWYGSGYLLGDAIAKEYPPATLPFVNGFDKTITLEAERMVPAEKSLVYGHEVPSQKVFDAMKAQIEQHRNDPKLLWWYLADEPEFRDLLPGYLQKQYEFIKKLDPYHPVMIITHRPDVFRDCADILNPHTYLNPILGKNGSRSMSPPQNITREVSLVAQATDRRKAAWFTPQAFSYAGPLGRIWNADYPNFTEFRVMMWTAVASGAKGFTPFIYSDHYNSLELRRGVPFIYQTIEELEPFLLQGADSLPLQVKSPDDSVQAMIKEHDGKLLLIAVNKSDNLTTATIESKLLKTLSQLQGFREESRAPVKNGAVQLSFAPYQVHLLTSEKLDGKLQNVEEFQRTLDVAAVALKKPSNILFGRGREIEWDTSNSIIPSRSLASTLTNGLTDAVAWIARGDEAPKIEMAFPTFVPKFRRAKIYSSNLQAAELWIWKYGEWQKVGEANNIADNAMSEQVAEMDLGEQVSTVKVQLRMKEKPGVKAEVYEIELYE